MGAPLAVLTMALAGCSISPQAEPVPVSAPPVVLPTTSTATAKGVPLTVQAYFLRGNHLTRISRTVPPSPGLAPSLAALAQPLSAAQVAAGLRTALPTSRPLQGKVADGVALVEMPPGYDRLGVREQVNALAQLVFTISANSLAGSLQLTRDGKPLPVPDGSGHLVDRPVSRSDYAAIQPAG